MNCLYIGSASQERVRGKGLWPVPVLCPGESVSQVPKLILTRPKKFLWLGGLRASSSHSLPYASSVATTTQNRQHFNSFPRRDLDAIAVKEAVMRQAPGESGCSGKAASSTWKPSPEFLARPPDARLPFPHSCFPLPLTWEASAPPHLPKSSQGLDPRVGPESAWLGTLRPSGERFPGPRGRGQRFGPIHSSWQPHFGFIWVARFGGGGR